ncbi:copper resistance CopC family protein [Paraburkholderia phosphatilytica]|uniref:copper resistance CopC family protein n=1 Tax=Paraburkholderia phosphatilytica TaxID=2282883 RepID=UPI000E4D5634|nr:copper resistance protein CopC [Paraburkholderia phosphatilytica]
MKNSKSTLMPLRGALAALAFSTAQLAYAHAYPTHQSPAAGATVTTSQQDVAIDFDDGLESAFSSIAVTDANQQSVTKGRAIVDPSNPKHMSVELNPLEPGVYTVAWVAVANDGHRTQGHYSFTAK